VSLVIDYYPAKFRTFVMGAIGIGSSIGGVIGRLLPVFIGLSGWRWTFFEFDGTFSIFALLGILFVKEP
jgi:MFS family permease